jgi:HSP20 family protein
MLSVTRWEPYRDVLTLQNRLSRLLGDNFTPFLGAEGVGAWLPPVDIVEEADRLTLRAEIAGVRTEDIDIKVENGTLVLRGEKKQEKEVGTESAHRLERYYGSFTRSFALPVSIDAEKIQARYKDGVLEIVLPKADEAKPRKIKIVEA